MTFSVLSAGAVLGEYTLLKPLAQGGMGAVYLARQQTTGAHRALKVMHPLLSEDEDMRARFAQEARSSALVPSDHVVQVIAAGVDEATGMPWMAMELLDGMDLGRYLAARGALDHAEVAEILAQVSHALGAAHEVGIVHRDLKPDNVFLATRRGVGASYIVKLLDFGIAKLLSGLPRATLAFGTPASMAPEQAQAGGMISPAADIWSFGLLAYQMLTGKGFWRGSRDGNGAMMLREVLVDEIPLASERAAEMLAPGALPSGFDAWFARAVVRDPTQRFATMGECWGQLRGLLGGAPVQAPARAGAPGGLTMLSGVKAPESHSASATTQPRTTDTSRPVRVTYRERFGRTVVTAQAGASLLSISRANEVPHFHVCNGNARCSTCRVMVHDGLAHLGPRTAAERKIADKKGWPDAIRLACQAQVNGDVVVRRLVVDTVDLQEVQAEAELSSPLRERNAVALVLKLRGFAAFAAQNLPYDVVHVAARLFRVLEEAVRGNGGEILRYDGAQLIALFGDGEEMTAQAMSALRAALRLRARLHALNQYLGKNYGAALELSTGLHVGSAFVGDLGVRKTPIITAMGEAIEVAEGAAQAASDAQLDIVATDALLGLLGDRVRPGRAVPAPAMLAERASLREVIEFDQPDAVFLVQSTLERVMPRGDEFAHSFYRRLFELAPDVEPLFDGVDMNQQRGMLMNVIATAVRGLNQLDELVPTVQALGRRHMGYGVKPAHYRHVGRALLETLQGFFADEFTPEVELAWREVYGTLARTMIDASRAPAPAAGGA